MEGPGREKLGAGSGRKPIALVFTDVAGSSAAKRAAALGLDPSARDRAYLKNVQARHLKLIRTVLAEYNGKEIMTIGDSFFLTFEDPVDAIRCVVAIQQRLREQPIETPSGPMKLRIGIHVGTPEFFDNSWHGTDVDIAARTQSAASPQQIVVTDAAREAMGSPFDIHFSLLGTFALKGVGDIRLWDAGYGLDKRRRPSLSSKEQRRRRRIFASVVLILGAAALAAGAGWRWRKERRDAMLASAAKESIIVTTFANQTGEPVFDNMLTGALIAQLEQSPILRLVGEQHLRQSLPYLGKSSDSELTPEVIREIGIREGIKAYLAGSIVKLGNAYVINVSAKDISTGDDIVSEEAEARNKEHVLGALDKVTTAMRSHLGESLGSIQKLDTPLGQATTPSLEAFEAYALGDVEHEKGQDIPQAEAHYRRALEIDPNFAMAWARLGIIAVNYGQQEEVVEDFRNAYRLSNNVAEREKMYIAAQYDHYVLGDLPKTIATFELASRTYPMDSMTAVNLGWAYGDYGQIGGFLSQFQKVAGTDPYNGIAQQDLLYAQLTLDQLKEAASTLADMKRRGLDNGATGVLMDHVMFDLLRNDEAGIRRTINQAESHPDRFAVTASVALAREFAGRYKEATADWARAQAQAATAKAYYFAASYQLSSVLGRANLGQCDGAARQIRAALALDRSKGILQQAAFAAALCNQRATALPILAELEKNYPSDTLVNEVTIPQSRAALALAAHKPADALRVLEGSQKFDTVSPGAYLRGLAYLDLQDGTNATQSFRAATRYRGAAYLCCQNYAQAQLGLARAETIAGDLETTRKSYKDFFTTWRNGDADLPQLIAAKKEFARLQ